MAVVQPSTPRVCVASIAAAHGVRGLVRVRVHAADPAALSGYGPLTDADGSTPLSLSLLSPAKGTWVAEVEGVTTRAGAEWLVGRDLYVARDLLPSTEDDEFYHADLIGLAVVDVGGAEIGTVRAVHDFGAGDLLDVARPGAPSVLVPFTDAVVPVVDLGAGRLVVDPPAGLIEPAAEASA